MADLRVFISSTCYDYSLLRSELRNFIVSLGYEPIMSDFSDVLYDPRIHTHLSCVDEVNNCDMLVVIIGSRFGGKSVPEALKAIDFSAIASLSSPKASIDPSKPISITQLEVLKAIECNVPVYVFIEKKVYYEHEVYEKNKNNSDILDKIVFPAIDKPETAKYIFGFIDYIRLRTIGNSIFQFERINDIEDILKKQWSGYFQRLLFEQRHRTNENRRMDTLDEKFEVLKTAILSSIENVDQRETARGVVRFKRLFEFLFSLGLSIKDLCSFDSTYRELLCYAGISDIVSSQDLDPDLIRGISSRHTFLILNDDSFFDVRYPKGIVLEYENDWNSFTQLSQKSKEIILDALYEMFHPNMTIRHHPEPFSAFLNKYSRYSDDSDE